MGLHQHNGAKESWVLRTGALNILREAGHSMTSVLSFELSGEFASKTTGISIDFKEPIQTLGRSNHVVTSTSSGHISFSVC